MHLKFLACFFLLFTAYAALAKDDNKYDVGNINPDLLKGANAVKRYELMRFEIKDAGKAFYYYKKAVTILNESGDKYASWSEQYDKNNYIRSVDAVLYDGSGKKIKALKNIDITDVSGTGDGNLADDARIKFHNFHYKLYPYTVEYEVEMKFNQLMFMPGWAPIEDDEFAVESSIFEVTAPISYKLRYKSFAYNKEPVITTTDTRLYHWEVSQLKPLADEFAAPELQKITPNVLLGATDFEIGNYKGDMSDWNHFGKFVYALKENRDNLPENIKKTVHELTANISDEKKKIQVLYNYMQQNTRYVSIQLGIGGWQPFDAAYVSEKKYGDCKALTNFMYSLLKEAGIKSVYTLVKAGRNRNNMVEDFASQQFNHVILSVPSAKDTVWLECTSQILPAGYLSSSTANRYALMITEDGGTLVHTPAYKMKDNLQTRTIKATIDEKGKLVADIVTNYKATQQDEIFQFINMHGKDEQLNRLKKDIDIPSYDIISFDYKTTASALPVVTENLNLVANNYAQVSGKRLFIYPNILNRMNNQLKDEERLQDINITNEYTDSDTIEIETPNGFVAESLPPAYGLSTRFGVYKIECKFSGNKIVMTRLLEKKSGAFPKTDYKDLVKFYNDMYKADRAKVVLVRKES